MGTILIMDVGLAVDAEPAIELARGAEPGRLRSSIGTARLQKTLPETFAENPSEA